MKKKKNNFSILLYVLVIVILIKLIDSCLFQEICIIIYKIFLILTVIPLTVYMSINISTKTDMKYLSLLRTSDKMHHKFQVFAKTQWHENSRLRTKITEFLCQHPCSFHLQSLSS